MKTAMQELIDELDLIKIVEKHNFFMVKYIIEQSLEKEKEQLMFFYHYGKTNGILNGKTSEEFYNQLYKQDRELPKDIKNILDNL